MPPAGPFAADTLAHAPLAAARPAVDPPASTSSGAGARASAGASASAVAAGGLADADRIAITANAALDSLRRFHLASTPEHFAVWYDYHAQANHLVRRLIDTYLTNRRPIDAAMMRVLHDRFYSPRSEAAALLETGQRLQMALRDALATVGEAGQDARRFDATLTGISQSMEFMPAGVSAVLLRLAEETRAVAARSEAVGRHLEHTVARVADLEVTLADARREATTDPLTGLANRRAFDDLLHRKAGLAQQSGQNLALMIADIDRFKSINDTWGHPVGDAVLRRVAMTLRDTLDENAHASRFGGEEFCVVVPGAATLAAIGIAERLREAVAQQNFQVRASGQALGRVTVSIGVAGYVPGEPLEAFLGRADTALYRAKQGGRNRVEHG